MQNIALTALFYALFQVLAGYAAQKLSDLWFLVLGSISVVFFTIAVVTYQLLLGNGLGKLSLNGFFLIFFANGAITLFSLFLGRSFQQTDPKTVVPLVFGGALFLSTVAGYILSKTFPTPYQLLSLLIISGGLVMLSINSTK